MNLSTNFKVVLCVLDQNPVNCRIQNSAVATCDEHISEGNLNASLCIGRFQKYCILKYSTSH